MTWKTRARQNNDRLLEFVSLLNGTCLVRKSEGMSFLKMEFGVRLKSGWLFFFLMLWIKLYTTSLLTLTKEQSQVLRMERRSERKTKVRRLLVKTSSSPFSFLFLSSSSPIRFSPVPSTSPPLTAARSWNIL